MTRKLQKVLVILAVAGASLFQVGGCDTAATEFLKGIEAGYADATGSSLAGDIGKELGGFTSGVPDTDLGYGWDEPDCCGGYGYGPTYWRYCQILWIGRDQAAFFFSPSTN